MSPHELIQGAAFDPETIELLSEAYEAAVKLIGNNQPPLVLETIAKQIIEAGGRGERNPHKMVEYAMRGLKRSSDGD